MARIMIKCPKTGKPVFTGMNADKGSLNQFQGNSFRCPLCREMHTWDGKDAWPEGEN